jgi:putative addiction module component (TIGR02574 family)
MASAPSSTSSANFPIPLSTAEKSAACVWRRDGSRRTFSRLDSSDLPHHVSAMPATLDAVAHDALILPPNQRLALVRQLLDSVDLEPEPGAEAAWEAEIVRRIARFEAGESQPVSAGEVFARLRQLAPGR